MRTRLSSIVLSVVSSVVMAACSSGSQTGALDASSVGNASSMMNALEGLLFDESAATRQSIRSQVAGPSPTVGDPSLLGCHYLVDRKRMFSDVNHVRVPLCYMSQVEAAGIGFSIGEEGYNYFEIAPPEGVDEKSFNLRVGKFTDANGKRCLRFQGCKDSSQTESFQLCEIDGGVNASVQHSWAYTDMQSNTATGNGSLDIEALGESSDAIESVTIGSAFADSHGWQGSAAFTADRGELKNTFIGRFLGGFEEFSNNNGVCVIAGSGVGSGHVTGTATFPAFQDPMDSLWYCPDPNTEFGRVSANDGDTCTDTYDHTASFEVVSVSPPECSIIADVDSPFFDAVADCVIPNAPADPTDFEETWDCSAPTEFTPIDMSDVDVSECQALEEEQRSGQDEHFNCDQKVAEGQEGGGPT